MRIATFFVLFLFQQAHAEDPKLPNGPYIVDSLCTEQSTECVTLMDEKYRPKVKSTMVCEKPSKKLKWKVPASLPEQYQREAAVMAERANSESYSGLCVFMAIYPGIQDRL